MSKYWTSMLSILLLWLLESCNKPDDKLFTSMPVSKTKVNFINSIVESEELNIMRYDYLYNGGGVAIGDINQDGLEDIYFTGNMVENKLFLNKGNLEFEDITVSAGVSGSGGWSSGVTMADVNCDGLLDIYVCRSAFDNYRQRRNLLYINNGDLTFTEKAALFGIDDSGYSTQATFFDYDQDGDLDMYLLNHSLSQYSGLNNEIAELKNRSNPMFGDKLFNNQNGHFVDVTSSTGIKSNVLGFGLGVAVSDINGDGWADIYVSNDFNEQDYLYINDKKGGFNEELENYITCVSLNSMGNDIADINNDGYMDILTLDMLPESNYRQKITAGPDNYYKFGLLEKLGFYHQSMRNMLQLNHGNDRGFSEIGQLSGISNTDWSWSALAADFDNDGLKDVFITNGFKHNFTNMDFIKYLADETIKEKNGNKKKSDMRIIEKMPPVDIPNYIFKNNGDLTFDAVMEEWGMDENSKSNGAAYADLDNDGDLDLVINNIDASASIYRNNANKLTQNHFLKIKLVGSECNVYGLGATIKVKTGKTTISQELMPSRGFQSSVGYGMTIGLGRAERVDTLSIFWLNGKRQVLTNIPVDTTLMIDHTQAESIDIEQSKNSGLFVKVSGIPGLDYKHNENSFNDFNTEILLPHKLSTQGPRLSIGDVNGDQLEDIFIGGAKGYAGRLCIQQSNGSFKVETVFEEDKESEDIDALFFDADNDSDLDLYVVSGGNEYAKNAIELQDRLYLNDGNGQFKKNESLPEILTSGSCVTANDMDGDGDQDLFVGGRLTPNGYPLSPRSYILENDGKGHFSDVTSRVSQQLLNPGMVTDAVWSDFDLDGKKDLIIVGEWMPISFFKNTGTELINLTDSVGTVDSEGWWNTIVAYDMDKDGDEDYMVGNLGMNSQIKATPEQPVSLIYKDFDEDGVVDPVLSYFNGGESFPALSMDDMIDGMRYLKERFATYDNYARQTTEDIFSEEEMKGAQKMVAKNMKTCYLENRNGKMSMQTLPMMAQVSPVQGILPGDFNKDGFMDMILVGNFYGSRVKFGRYDASKGVLLLGSPEGNFKYSEVEESGLNIKGEVRDVGVLSYQSHSLLVIVKNNGPVEIWTENDKEIELNQNW